MATQNSINTSNPFYLSLLGAKAVSAFGSNLPAGDNDLYTVPAGKKALFGPIAQRYNSSAGSIILFPKIKVGGTYYRINSNATLATNTSSSATIFVSSIILNAGESISVNTDSAGLNIWLQALEFDASETRLITARLLSLSAGNNTLYTVPTGKTAFASNGILTGGSVVYYVNDSGATRTITWYLVPNGGSAGPTNQSSSALSVSNTNVNASNSLPSFNSGDFIVVNTDAATATQIAWVTLFEI